MLLCCDTLNFAPGERSHHVCTLSDFLPSLSYGTLTRRSELKHALLREGSKRDCTSNSLANASMTASAVAKSRREALPSSGVRCGDMITEPREAVGILPFL